MGYKHAFLTFANTLAPVAFFFNRKLPTYYQGFWIWVPKQSWNSVYFRYEPYTAKAIKAHLRTGDTFWDIGAHIGWFSLFASKIVGSMGKVVSFEPSPDVFNLLSANTRDVYSIRAIQCGIGNADTLRTFAAQGAATSASFVEDVTRINLRYIPETPVRHVEVSLRKVDTLVNELGHRPNLAKIDVEGFELEVLKGASGLLSAFRPTLIMEIHPRQLDLSGGSEALLHRLLKEYGYRWEVIDRNQNSIYSIIAKPG